MASWLRVVEGDGDQPRVIDQGLEPDLVYARPPELVTWGGVDGIPWRIQAAVTAPGSNAKWWEHGPVGPELVFMLGRDDEFGGGGVNTLLNEGTHLTASIHFFGSLPQIVSWVGVVSDDVASLDVRLDDGDARAIELHHGPVDFTRIFWFFPPRGAAGAVAARGRRRRTSIRGSRRRRGSSPLERRDDRQRLRPPGRPACIRVARRPDGIRSRRRPAARRRPPPPRSDVPDLRDPT
jgi:hypothetical protein